MKNKLQIKKPALFNFKVFPEFNGTLVPFYTNSFFPKYFKLKRFFTLYGKKKYFRADHAHKKCTQIIIPLRGTMKVKIKSRKLNKIFMLSVNKKKALYIPPYNWVTIFFKNDMDSILTLCDFKYDKKEYISEYQNFKKLIYK